MPLLEETSLPQSHSLTLPVVIIGNGPSGICLSYLLSGNRPYVAPGIVHPNPVLQNKLEEGSHYSVVHQDLEYLAEGLEGRSSNPVAVLFDTLLHPDADFQFDYPSVLQWKLEKHENIPHIVLGKGLPGGAWHVMKGSMLTISLGNWMELPGLKFKDWASSKRRNLTNDRATPEDIASYYKDYVKIMGLQKNFVDCTCVTSVSKFQQDQENTDDEIDISTQQLPATDGADQHGLSHSLWEVSGYQRIGDGSPVPFCLFAENVVLATGTYDSPTRLGVEGEDLPFVFHSISDFEVAIKDHKVNQASDPVLIVGAGLTAADAILCAYHNNIPVIHTFRRSVNDPGLIFKQLPKTLYPEYHKVYHKMCKQSYSTASGPYTNYTSFPENCIVSFQPDMKCILQSASGVKTVLSISLALILIGSYPNLSFLKDHGKYLGLDPSKPISCKRNPIDINPCTFECIKEATFFCMGPLIGDNFVRFLKGGALGITSCLIKRLKKKGRLISEVGGADG